MLVGRDLVERLEAVEAEADARLAHALRATTGDTAVEVRRFGRGVLVATGAGRYVNRAVGVTLDELSTDDVDDLVAWYVHRGLPPALQLSPWAPPATVASVAARGFVPTASRSVLVRAVLDDPEDRHVHPGITVVEVDGVTGVDAQDVMAGAGGDRRVSDEFMAADRAAEGTVQLLALLEGRPVGCGSVTVVGGTAWLGAAKTVPAARRRGVQATLVAHRVDLARGRGCDLVGATASVGSDSARNLQRLGFALVEDQWVLERRDPPTRVDERAPVDRGIGAGPDTG